MKPLRWPTNQAEAAYLLQRKEENVVRSLRNGNEGWMETRLKTTPHKWARQVTWGYRIFDFWCHALGCAVEVDGPEHDPNYDSYRDEYNFRRSAVVVLRVRNRNEMDAERALSVIAQLGSWKDRRVELGIVGGKKQKRSLAVLPRHPSLLEQYLRKMGHST